MKKISALLIACSVGMAAQAQTIIDALTGSGPTYTTTLLNDVSHGSTGLSFTTSGSGLQASYVGTGTTAEQGVFLATVGSFSSTFSVGQTLSVNVNMPATATQMDFGLVIAASATPIAASAGNSWDSRSTFDWASISLRPSQTAIRVNFSTNNAVITGNGVAGIGASANISQLFIQWVSTDVFNMGYVSNSIPVIDYTVTFKPTSTIGAAIGFYGDLRATSTSLGTFSNLAITPIPEPSSLALCGMSFLGLVAVMRRKK